MKIYLDDMRPVPEGWVVARSSTEFKALISRCFETKEKIEAISFDNDLGEPIEGYDLLKWLADTYPEFVTGETKLTAHSANPPARENMEQFIESCRRHADILRENASELRKTFN